MADASTFLLLHILLFNPQPVRVECSQPSCLSLVNTEPDIIMSLDARKKRFTVTGAQRQSILSDKTL